MRRYLQIRALMRRVCVVCVFITSAPKGQIERLSNSCTWVFIALCKTVGHNLSVHMNRNYKKNETVRTQKRNNHSILFGYINASNYVRQNRTKNQTCFRPSLNLLVRVHVCVCVCIERNGKRILARSFSSPVVVIHVDRCWPRCVLHLHQHTGRVVVVVVFAVVVHRQRHTHTNTRAMKSPHTSKRTTGEL